MFFMKHLCFILLFNKKVYVFDEKKNRLRKSVQRQNKIRSAVRILRPAASQDPETGSGSGCTKSMILIRLLRTNQIK